MDNVRVKATDQVLYSIVLDGYSIARILSIIDGRLLKLENGFGNWSEWYRKHEINTLKNCKNKIMRNLKGLE